MRFLYYAAEEAAADYYARSLRFYHVRGGMLFRLPTPLVSILSNSSFYKFSEKMRMDPVLVALMFY